MGVEPLQPGIATFHATFSSVVHFAGRFFSVLTPLRFGPRHCGQFSARTCDEARSRIDRVISRLVTPFSLLITRHSPRRAGNRGDRRAAQVASKDAIKPDINTASSRTPRDMLGNRPPRSMKTGAIASNAHNAPVTSPASNRKAFSATTINVK